MRGEFDDGGGARPACAEDDAAGGEAAELGHQRLLDGQRVGHLAARVHEELVGAAHVAEPDGRELVTLARALDVLELHLAALAPEHVARRPRRARGVRARRRPRGRRTRGARLRRVERPVPRRERLHAGEHEVALRRRLERGGDAGHRREAAVRRHPRADERHPAELGLAVLREDADPILAHLDPRGVRERRAAVHDGLARAQRRDRVGVEREHRLEQHGDGVDQRRPQLGGRAQQQRRRRRRRRRVVVEQAARAVAQVAKEVVREADHVEGGQEGERALVRGERQVERLLLGAPLRVARPQEPAVRERHRLGQRRRPRREHHHRHVVGLRRPNRGVWRRQRRAGKCELARLERRELDLGALNEQQRARGARGGNRARHRREAAARHHQRAPQPGGERAQRRRRLPPVEVDDDAATLCHRNAQRQAVGARVAEHRHARAAPQTVGCDERRAPRTRSANASKETGGRLRVLELHGTRKGLEPNRRAAPSEIAPSVSSWSWRR